MEHGERGSLPDLQRRRAAAGDDPEHAAQTAEYLDANLGVYVQDSWHINRFTVNAGLRYDFVRQRVLSEPAQTGRFASSLAYDDIYLPTWKSWSPRTSVVTV